MERFDKVTLNIKNLSPKVALHHMVITLKSGSFTYSLSKKPVANLNELCTALVVGSDDVASSYGIGVLTRRQVSRREGGREARIVASY